jgi:hypothetical protein
VFAGMLGVTLFGIFLTPVFFVTVRRVTEWWGRRSAARNAEDRAILAENAAHHVHPVKETSGAG